MESERRPEPPLPPTAESLPPPVAGGGLHPVLDLFQSQVAALQRQLEAERARAAAAQGELDRQQALRAEVEGALKDLSEQLRREKAERESEETQSRARGRIDALEARLDQMHQTWANLLRDAIARREGAGEETRAVERELSRQLSALAESVAALREQKAEPAGPSAHAAELAAALADLKARFDSELARVAARVEELGAAAARSAREAQAEAARETAALSSALDGVGLQVERQLGERFAFLAAELKGRLEGLGALRQELHHERAQRERQAGEQGAHVSRALDELKARAEASAAEAAAVRADLARALQILSAPAKAKDHVLAELEQEKQDLIRALKERASTFDKYVTERRRVEKTLGESLTEVHARLDAERDKALAAERERAGLALALKAAEDRLALAARAAEEQDKRLAELAAQRDQLARALAGEAEKVRAQLAARTEAEQGWNERDLELRRRLAEETKKSSESEVAVAELRARLATLSEHMAKALQEKEAVVSRYAAWDKERAQLLKTIRDKDDMIAMISSTFQNLLKKP